MKKLIFTILFCFMVTLVEAEAYKSILVITTLEREQWTVKDKDGKDVIVKADELHLKLPFKTYAMNCVLNGKDITYRMHDVSMEGQEVLCKVDFRQTDMEGTDVVDQTAIAEAFPGNMGQDWSKLKKDARYTKHYSVTKADALATYTDEGVKIPYNGADKNDVVKFTQWEEEVPDESIIEIIQ